MATYVEVRAQQEFVSLMETIALVRDERDSYRGVSRPAGCARGERGVDRLALPRSRLQLRNTSTGAKTFWPTPPPLPPFTMMRSRLRGTNRF